MYKTVRFRIKRNHPLFEWCETNSRLANNLYNAALFRLRNSLTGSKKETSELTENEKEVLREIEMNCIRHRPSPSGALSYYALDELMRNSRNPDFYSGIPIHAAGNVMKSVCEAMKSFFAAVKAYNKDNSAFSGSPGLPGYRKKGGLCFFTCSNQECHLFEGHGKLRLKLPKSKVSLSMGRYPVSGKLMEVNVIPDNGCFGILVTFDTAASVPEPAGRSVRIAAVDLGVSNLMTVTNNIGEPCTLYKGGRIKSINRLWAKKAGEIQSRQLEHKNRFRKEDSDKPVYFVPTRAYHELTDKRNNRVRDLFHKTAKHLVDWCVENRIDTVVIGANRDWKREVGLGKKENQKFVTIPYGMLKSFIRYRCEREGIRFIETEESYTSKASFPDKDDIPVYDRNNEKKYAFSGKRGVGNKRWMYTAHDGTIIHSDINGSANIMRKAFPYAFDSSALKFDSINVVR